MNKFKKRRLKKKLKENKYKILIAFIFFLVVVMSVGYASRNTVVRIYGRATIDDNDCEVHVTGNFTVNGSWGETENAIINIDNYETTPLDGFTIKMKFPSGTTIGPFQQCINNTIDNYLVQDANGEITVSFYPGSSSECMWLSQIPAGTLSNGVVTPGSWSSGNGFYFQVHNTAIDSENPIYPDYVTFDGCTIYGSGGNQDNPLTALGLTPSSATIGIGEVLNLTTTKTPSYKQVSLTYTSSDTSVATVDSNGTVTGIGEGTAIITVSGDGLSATSTITVEETIIEPTGITITPSSYRMTIGEIVPLQATITPANASTTITWSSSDPSIATVDSSGNVTAISTGSATITATTSNNISNTSQIRVVDPVTSNDLDINFSLNNEYTHGDLYTFTITIDNLTDERIDYFKIGLDVPSNVTFNLWQSNMNVLGNYLELISNDWTYIAPNGTFTIMGTITFPSEVLIDGQDPWGNAAKIIPDEYLDPEIISIEYE